MPVLVPLLVTIGCPADPVLGPQEGTVRGSSIGAPAGFYWTPADRWWALKRGQCWFPCWDHWTSFGPGVGPVLVPLLGFCWTSCRPGVGRSRGASVGSPAGLLLDFLPTRCWDHKRGQCWFPCWLLLDLLLTVGIGHFVGPVLVPQLGTD
jgi:hypothetical protein